MSGTEPSQPVAVEEFEQVKAQKEEEEVLSCDDGPKTEGQARRSYTQAIGGQVVLYSDEEEV
jgi:hypothetical protein